MGEFIPGLTGKTLLVAEDDDHLRQMLVAEFELQGARVVQASNGNDACDFLATTKFDGIISDIRMPGGDGIDLLKFAKSLDYAVPTVMFITGFSDLSVPDAYELGVDAILMKPFDLDELLVTVKKMLTPKATRWASPSEAQAPVVQITRHYESLASAVRDGLLQIGRGGAFIQSDERIVQRNTELKLDLKFGEGPVHSIEGGATIRWIRRKNESGRAAGWGVEFTHLTERSSRELSAVIVSSKIVPYIPGG